MYVPTGETKLRFRNMYADEATNAFESNRLESKKFMAPVLVLARAPSAGSAVVGFGRAPRRACRLICSRRVGPSKFACCLLNESSSIASDVASSLLAGAVYELMLQL